MKRYFLAFIVIAFVSFSLSAQVNRSEQNVAVKKIEQKKIEKQKYDKERIPQAQVQNPQEDNPNAPVLTFEKTVHDYGTIDQYSDGTCFFVFTNTGKEPLILSNVRAS